MIEVKTDLRGSFGPARDQGPRPTCLAFAASDAHAGLREGWVPLSCEYLFYQAQRRGGRPPSVGALRPLMLEALKEDGQPEENAWQYLPKTPADTANWKPPASVGQCFGRNGAISNDDLTAVCELLDKQRPVILHLALSDSFYKPDAEGVVTPASDERPDFSRRHAVVAVGHGLVNGVRSVLVRNSWGAPWGIDGHAWLTEVFVQPRLLAITVLSEEVDVSAGSTTA